MNNKEEIYRCIYSIQRANALINQLTNSGKNKKVKKSAGKMILMERKNIKAMKTKLILLGTTYEYQYEQYRTRSIASGRQSGKSSFEDAANYARFSPGITGAKAKSTITGRYIQRKTW